MKTARPTSTPYMKTARLSSNNTNSTKPLIGGMRYTKFRYKPFPRKLLSGRNINNYLNTLLSAICVTDMLGMVVDHITLFDAIISSIQATDPKLYTILVSLQSKKKLNKCRLFKRYKKKRILCDLINSINIFNNSIENTTQFINRYNDNKKSCESYKYTNKICNGRTYDTNKTYCILASEYNKKCKRSNQKLRRRRLNKCIKSINTK